MKKKRVWFKMPVDFHAESEAGLEHAIKSYLADPCHEVGGCNVELGCYAWKQGRVVMTRKDRSDAADDISTKEK